MMVWVTALAFVPLSVFLASFYLFHIMVPKEKDRKIEKINLEVQKALLTASSSGSLESIDRLEKLMSAQEKVQNMKEWPIAPSGAVTFVVTLAAAVVQVIVAVSGSGSPGP